MKMRWAPIHYWCYEQGGLPMMSIRGCIKPFFKSLFIVFVTSELLFLVSSAYGVQFFNPCPCINNAYVKIVCICSHLLCIPTYPEQNNISK